MSSTSHWKWCAVIPSVRNHFGLIIQCHIVHCYVSQEVSYCKTVLYQHKLVLCLRLQPFWSSLSGNRRFITNVQWKKLMKLLFFFKMSLCTRQEKQLIHAKHLPKRLTLNITYSTEFPLQTTVYKDTTGLQK